MTAVSAFLSWGSPRDPVDAVSDMLRSQKAYGPDGSGAFSFGAAALGRALFRLVPEDAFDDQPAISPCGRLALVADVRLDNGPELLSALGERRPGGSVSDSRILLAALHKWGAGALDRIAGDYAFILWDDRSKELTLARDPLGQRPLYYHLGHRFAAVASMPKGLHAIREVPHEADPEWLMDFIGYVPHRGPRSQYRSISRVEAGHIVRIRAGEATSRRFWSPAQSTQDARDLEGLKDRFRAELDRAVDARLRRASGAAGAHLSGGWDSSAVAGTAASLLARRGETLFGLTSVPRAGSVAPSVGSTFSNEAALAGDAAAMHPNLQHILVPGSGTSPLASLDRIHDLYDRPLATLCNNVWMSRIRDVATQRGMSVLLTGEVGNWTISSGHYTLLADYLRHMRWLKWFAEASAVGRARRIRFRGILGASFAPFLPRYLQEKAAIFSSGINTAAYTAAHPKIRAQLAWKRRRLFDGLPASHHGRTAEALMHRDFGDYRKAALAGWGIDERDPTADRRLAEFCLSLPLEALLNDGQRRPLAKAALADRVPTSILDQRLKGYQGADWHEGLTSDRQHILDLIEEMASDTMTASLLDLEGMREWVRDWPSAGWEDLRVTARYRTALLVGLSAGHFALRANR